MTLDAALVTRLDAELEADLARDGRLGNTHRYLRGDHDMPYMPSGAKREFRHLAKRSITNWTPLISDTYSHGLFVDGHRPARAADNSTAWSYWQANGLDARQTIAHRGALEYGTSYTLVLPGAVQQKRVPYFRPLDPLRSAAWFADPDDEFPEIGLRRKGTTVDGTQLVELLDKTSVYTFAKPKPRNADDRPAWALSKVDDHGLGVTPFVRFRDRLDGESQGIIRPIINLQDRVNEVVFSTLIALQYASFRQRWATGLAIPEDEDGNPIEPLQAAVDRVWVAEDEKAKFGDFAQTELSGHHQAYTQTVSTLAAVSQVSPTAMMGDLVNISAEALAALQDSTQRKLGEYETNFGESWESGFRLAALAAGDTAGANDLGAQVRWRDTEARSLAATVDALGKIATMLSVPVEALWEKIPGVTDQDVTRWTALREANPDPLAALVAETSRQLDGEPAIEVEDAAELQAKADALGVMIRAGIEPADAAAKTGLTGVRFTGAVPTSLRLPETDANALEGK